MNILSSLQAWDLSLLNAIRSHLIIHTSWFPTFILGFADSEPIVFALLLVGLWLFAVAYKDATKKYIALDLFLYVMVVFAVYAVINQFLPIRPRPESLSSLPPLIDHLPDNSFPSGHAIFFGASWWALARLTQWKKTTYFFFFLGLATVSARVIAGIHYPGDILVGFFLGWGLMALLCKIPRGKKYHTLQEKIIRLTAIIGL